MLGGGNPDRAIALALPQSQKTKCLKSATILAIILLSLIPVYLFYRWLRKVIRPEASMARLLLFLLTGFALVFVYTFFVVFIVKVLFPGA